jgi:hypothetical protein
VLAPHASELAAIIDPFPAAMGLPMPKLGYLAALREFATLNATHPAAGQAVIDRVVALTSADPPEENNSLDGGSHGQDDRHQRQLGAAHLARPWARAAPLLGQDGYFAMPYAYVTDSNLADDFWTIRLTK